MDILEKIRYWSHSRQRLGQSGTSGQAVLKDVVAVYSTHPMGPLSLAARVKNFSTRDFHLLDHPQNTLRIPAMRLSVHLVPTQAAETIFAATVPPADDSIWELRYAQAGREIPKEKYDQWRQSLLDLATTPLSPKEIKAQTNVPDEVLKPLLNRLAFQRELVRVSDENLRANSLRYVSMEAHLGRKLEMPDPGKALSDLAYFYLKAFGPARIKDFQWWAGTTVGKAKKAIEMLDTETLQEDLLLLKEDVQAFEVFSDVLEDTVDLLPQWDCYTMGYAPNGRKRFVDPDFQPYIYGKLGATRGNGLGAVLFNGLATASWQARLKGKRMEVEVQWFEKPTDKMSRSVQERLEQIAHLLDTQHVEIESSYINNH